MSITDFLEDAEKPRGGKWAKCFNEGDRLEGVLVAIEVTDRRDPDGEIEYGKKSGKARKVYRVTLRVTPEDADDDGLRVWDANESAQTAIREAYKAVGTKELVGGRFMIKVVEPSTQKSQAEYKAKFEPAPKTVELPDTDDGDDW